MSTFDSPLISRQFLRSHWSDDFEAFRDSPEEAELLERLTRWSARTDLKETSAESALLEEFFGKTWGYKQSGQVDGGETFDLYPKFPVKGAGAKGGQGEADAALGRFEALDGGGVPQVVCEFKDIKSRLDAPQKRKGNTRSPVRQGLDYLHHAQRDVAVFAPIRPEWAIITDMNEFRLYWSQRGERQFMQFVIRPDDLLQGGGLLQDNEDARFDRYVFKRIFSRKMLLVPGSSGKAPLSHLIDTQWVKEKQLENQFYEEYRAYRDHLYRKLLQYNGPGSDRFPGTKGRLVRLAQKILDRAIFIFFCEDMGKRIGYPPQLLRDFLSEKSNSPYFDPKGTTIWTELKQLFNAMDKGGKFGPQTLNRFNGGLFETDEDLDKLELPNEVFCLEGQGANEQGLKRYPKTLLYLSAAYNYATGFSDSLDQADKIAANAEQLGLYTLGRIFEQSITELEILEAEEDGRLSLNKVNKRKRDGVYYTPEWVVDRIVEETLGTRLTEMKAECGWPDTDKGKYPTAEQIDAYDEKLRAIKIVDPACGSGAFLITALRYLFREWYALRDLRRQVTGKPYARERDELIKDILRDNIYGVDINAASVEIAKLALWLHTASADKPLSSLDSNIKEGNSLIGRDFFPNLLDASAEEIERINPFDWEGSFPEAFEQGGFDIVIGNPPYVKLQNFRRVHPDMADFLKTDRAGNVTYESTQTGNFDLYLPFIEKGIELLNDTGRLGYIAPSLWPMNEYGAGLRNYIMRGRHLYGWIDFQSHQVFDEATIYTSLQFFTKTPNDTVQVAFAPTGDVPAQPWAGNDAALTYDKLTFRDRWLMVTGADRDVIDTAREGSLDLDDPRVTRHIFVGIQTSADDIYHLRKIGPGHYVCKPNSGREQPEYEVEIEDDIMKPLVSGPEAKRYTTPATKTYLLFPYEAQAGRVSLISQKDMAAKYPKAWKHFESWEDDLRGRESNKMDIDDGWWGYNYPKNLDKQEIEKLIVAQTVPNLRVAADFDSTAYLNNVRVNGIVASDQTSLPFVLGCLNASASDFIFRRQAKPKDGGYFEANKQFIAPLPIPDATGDQQADIGKRATRLQSLHSRRRDRVDAIGKRVAALPKRNKPLSWLFVELTPKKDLQADAPTHLDAQKKRDWAKRTYDETLDARYDAITARLSPGIDLGARLEAGELIFTAGSIPILDNIYVDDDEAPFILAQWTYLASTFSITASTTGKRLCNALRNLAVTDNKAVIDQVINLQGELSDIEADIDVAEHEMNALVYELFGLSNTQISHIETSLNMRT